MCLHFPLLIWRYRDLVWRLTERDVLSRYRGSLLGLTWSFLQPVAMLAVYTFVFSEVFKARWGTLEQAGPAGFAINLFAGLIAFNIFAESLSKSPYLIVANPNYVKKIVFPLETLGVVAVASACFHAVVSVFVLLAFLLIATHALPATLFWLPLVWLPLFMMTLASVWLVSALGVFLRDAGQIIAVFVNMLLFLSPVFFPVASLPIAMRRIVGLNPLAQIIEQTREVIVSAHPPSLLYILLAPLLSLLACEASFRLFQKVKPHFADVI